MTVQLKLSIDDIQTTDGDFLRAVVKDTANQIGEIQVLNEDTGEYETKPQYKSITVNLNPFKSDGSEKTDTEKKDEIISIATDRFQNFYAQLQTKDELPAGTIIYDTTDS